MSRYFDSNIASFVSTSKGSKEPDIVSRMLESSLIGWHFVPSSPKYLDMVCVAVLASDGCDVTLHIIKISI